MPFNILIALLDKPDDKSLSLFPRAENVLLTIPGSLPSPGPSPLVSFYLSILVCTKFVVKAPSIEPNNMVFALVWFRI